MARLLLLLASVNGFMAVALGAFGAHGLRKSLASLPDAADRLGWWHTAAAYQLHHALALGLVALLARQNPPSWCLRASAWGFTLGIVLFCGSLYAMTLTGRRGLGAITPFGGVGFLVGWAACAVYAWKQAGA